MLQQQAPASAAEVPSGVGGLRVAGGSALQESVQLLTACRTEELHKLEQLAGTKKVLAVFRYALAARVPMILSTHASFQAVLCRVSGLLLTLDEPRASMPLDRSYHGMQMDVCM